MVEVWYADFIGDARVGWTRVRYHPPRDGRVTIQSESELAVQRFGTQVKQTIRSSSQEMPDGRVHSFESTSESGGDMQRIAGVVEGDRLRIESSSGGNTDVHHLEWKPEYGGYFALEQSLRRQPLQPGARRALTAILPVLNQLAMFTLRATDYESTTVLDGTRELLRVVVTMQLGQHQLETLVWTDRQGEIIKSKVPTLGQVSYRTSRERALEHGGERNFDLGAATLVRVANAPRELPDARRAVYELTLTDGGSLRELFTESEGQRVRSLDPEQKRLEIEVRSIRPDSARGRQAATTPPPDDGSRLPNARIQSDALEVSRLAAEVESSEDTWVLACRLEKLVRNKMQPKEFAPALASAATVAKTLQGDCTEHAVLLAALCRNRGIPARVACGLVYSPGDEAFAYHMWTEVWIADRWLALDGTRGREGISAAYLKLADSNLQSGEDADLFLPVFRVMGGLKISVKEWE